MADFANSESVILKHVRAAWLNIFTPGEAMNGGEPKYKVTGLFEPGTENETVCKKAMVEAASKLWGANAVNVIRSMPANNKALRDGNNKMEDDGSVRPEYADLMFVSASNKSRPQVVGPKKHNGKFVTITESGRGMVDGIDVTEQLGYELKAPYRGCYVNMKVQFVAGKQKTINKGGKEVILPNQVYAKIEAVQFVADGEAFGAGPTSAEGFGEEEVTEKGDDPFDDDIPF